jgi:hypothetical protein
MSRTEAICILVVAFVFAVATLESSKPRAVISPHGDDEFFVTVVRGKAGTYGRNDQPLEGPNRDKAFEAVRTLERERGQTATVSEREYSFYVTFPPK